MLSIATRIKTLLAHKKLSIEKFAKLFGLSRVAFSRRLSRNNFTADDLTKIAKLVGAEYQSFFIFPDGTKI
jgi:transcriptional regulator with XRE-family HTH domain